MQALLRAAGQTRHGLARRNYALVTVLAETGLRVSELCGLRRDDLELRERSGQLRVRQGKGRKERVLPLNSNARRALRVYLADRLSSNELGQRAHIRRLAVTPHLMRHTFAVRYLKRNPGRLLELAALLGHDSLDTTAIYTRRLRPSNSRPAWSGIGGDDRDRASSAAFATEWHPAS
jgi:integrase/recombinase XerC